MHDSRVAAQIKTGRSCYVVIGNHGAERSASIPERLLAESPANLANALRAGGMIPELRAMRLKEIAARVKDAYGCGLRAALMEPVTQVRKILKKFPSIADPGAGRILLFAGIAPVAAVPSNCPHVLVGIQRGPERENYGVTYREAQQAIEAEVPEKFDASARAYLLLNARALMPLLLSLSAYAFAVPQSPLGKVSESKDVHAEAAYRASL